MTRVRIRRSSDERFVVVTAGAERPSPRVMTNSRIIDLAEMMQRYFPDLEIQRTEMKFQDSRNYQVTSKKAERTFGFSPGRNLEESIVELREIVRSNRIKNVAIPRHSNHRYLKELLERPASPLGYEAPMDV